MKSIFWLRKTSPGGRPKNIAEPSTQTSPVPECPQIIRMSRTPPIKKCGLDYLKTLGHGRIRATRPSVSGTPSSRTVWAKAWTVLQWWWTNQGDGMRSHVMSLCPSYVMVVRIYIYHISSLQILLRLARGSMCFVLCSCPIWLPYLMFNIKVLQN